MRLFHGNAPQLFRFKAALAQFLLRGFLVFLCLPHDIQRESWSSAMRQCVVLVDYCRCTAVLLVRACLEKIEYCC